MKNKKKYLLAFLAILIMAAVAASFILPQPGAKIAGRTVPDLYLNRFRPWKLGLDLAGGTALVYDVDLTGIAGTDHQKILNGLKDVIEKRINFYGVAEPKVVVAKKGDHYQLLVEIAGVRDLGQAAEMIGETPVLGFWENCRTENNSLLCDRTELTGRNIKRAAVEYDQLGQAYVSLTFDTEGTKIFETVTERNVGKPLCIFVDNDFIFPDDPAGSCPRVNEKITGGQASISGGGITPEVAQKFAERFNAGAIAAPINLVNQRTVNASAATDSLDKMILAGFIGVGLVILFMLGYYRFFGLIASIALIFYIVFSLAVFKLIPNFTLSLAGITGFILSVGMAVDANILIFERTREERRQGLGMKESLENGFRRAWTSIRDSNSSTILSSIILYYLTSSFVRGFALTLLFGVLVSLFSAITISRTMLLLFIPESKAKSAGKIINQ
jgi:preprotein translocase subunit SecD